MCSTCYWNLCKLTKPSNATTASIVPAFGVLEYKCFDKHGDSAATHGTSQGVLGCNTAACIGLGVSATKPGSTSQTVKLRLNNTEVK